MEAYKQSSNQTELEPWPKLEEEGAEVSDKHANFIINRGDATALDIETLINYAQQTVADFHGVHLLPEVRIVGEAT